MTRNEKRTATKERFVNFKNIFPTNWVGLCFHVLLMKFPILKAFFVAVLFLLQNLGSILWKNYHDCEACRAAGQGFFSPQRTQSAQRKTLRA